MAKERFEGSFRNRQNMGHVSLGQVQIDVRQAALLFDVLDYNNSGTLDSEEFLEALNGEWSEFASCTGDSFPLGVVLATADLQLAAQGIMLARGEARSGEVIAAQCDLWKAGGSRHNCLYSLPL